MQKEQTPPHAAAPPTESRLRWGKPKPALANPEKSGGAKLRDYGAETALAKSAMFAGLQWQTRGNPVTQRLGPTPRKPRNGSPPAG